MVITSLIIAVGLVVGPMVFAGSFFGSLLRMGPGMGIDIGNLLLRVAGAVVAGLVLAVWL